jgi:hypothetical protein
MMTCTVCGGTGFTNLHQIPDQELAGMSDDLVTHVPKWMACQLEPHDVSVCHCCGDGDEWYGVPGHHYGPDDPLGKDGPYADNGGFCLCH